VVDEAYVEFGGKASVIELLDKYDNLLVLRTLSKALGFAGARCGAVAGPAEVVRMLSAIQAPYALATPVVECVEDALQSSQMEAQETVADIIAERSRLADALQAFPFVSRVWPSDANFLLVRVDDARAIMEQCANDGVLLRHFGGPLEDCIRITIGSRDENNALLKILTTIGKRRHG
jgi:histidinol-phosphate aminotransferase